MTDWAQQDSTDGFRAWNWPREGTLVTRSSVPHRSLVAARTIPHVGAPPYTQSMSEFAPIFDLDEQLAVLGRNATAARSALSVVATEIDGALSNMLQFLGRFGAGLAKESMLTYSASRGAALYDPANVATSAIASVVFMGRLRCPRTLSELDALIGTVRSCGFEVDGSRGHGKAGHQEAQLKQRVVDFLCRLGPRSDARDLRNSDSPPSTAPSALGNSEQIGNQRPKAGNSGSDGRAKRQRGRSSSFNSMKAKLLRVVANAGRIGAGAAAKRAGIGRINTAYKYAAAFQNEYATHFALDEDEKGARVFEWVCPTPTKPCPECARLGAARRRTR